MRNRERLWPWGIGAVLALTVAGNAAVYWAANDANAAAVEPDYYRKAVEWDSTLAQEARDARLGWRADATLGTPAADGSSLATFTLRDASDAPVAGARLQLVAIHNAAAATPVEASGLTDDRGGLTLRLPLVHHGLWELRLTAIRGTTRFTATLRRETGQAARIP